VEEEEETNEYAWNLSNAVPASSTVANWTTPAPLLLPCSKRTSACSTVPVVWKSSTRSSFEVDQGSCRGREKRGQYGRKKSGKDGRGREREEKTYVANVDLLTRRDVGTRNSSSETTSRRSTRNTSKLRSSSVRTLRTSETAELLLLLETRVESSSESTTTAEASSEATATTETAGEATATAETTACTVREAVFADLKSRALEVEAVVHGCYATRSAHALQRRGDWKGRGNALMAF
jgi:hypothetical protein